MHPSFVCGLALAATLPAFTAHALVTNGSLTQTNLGGFFLPQNSDLPPGWTIASGSPDVLTPTANVGVGGLTYPVSGVTFSPDGGTWVGLGRDDNTAFLEAMSQTLSGLAVGQAYRLTWYAANFGSKATSGVPAYQADNAIQLQLDGVRVGAGDVMAQGSSWYAQSLQFTASATQQVLRFQPDLGSRSYLSIDGIALHAVTAVPEPAAWALMLVGVLALAGRARAAAGRGYSRNSKPASATTRPFT